MTRLAAARAATALLALGALLLPASPARAGLFGGSSQKRALLWVPDPKGLDWASLRALLERRSGAKLTLALAPQDIPEGARPWLVELSSHGRVEVALRIPGDPILPVIHRYRARDFVDRLAMGRSLYKQLFDRLPAGFVAGHGALGPESAQPLEKQGFAWTAAGDGALRSPWYTPGNMVVVPFHAPASSSDEDLRPPEGCRAVVLEERGLELLQKVLSEDEGAWTTVSEMLQSASPYAAGPDSWPSWAGEAGAWTSDPSQKRAWDLYARTVQALQRYEDSGAANLNTLNQATQFLYSAQSSKYYRPGALKEAGVEREFTGLLHRVFRLIGQPPPKVLAGPSPAPPAAGGFAGAGEARSGSRGGAAGAAEGADDGSAGDEGGWRVRSGVEGRSLWFENPLAAGTTAQGPWAPRELRVAWDEKALTFTFEMSALEGASRSPAGMGSLLLDLYIDINHLAGRGSTTLLSGRWGFVAQRDAWEFAVSLSGWGGGLYRSNPGQEPTLVVPLRPEVDAKSRRIRVSVPRSSLRGNPAGWGYLLLSMATDRAHAQAAPPEPLPGGGRPLLGLLGPLQAQAELKKAGATRYKRFSAVRTED